MRVLLTSPYDLAVPGGVNRHALDLLDALRARGHEARLLAPSSEPESIRDDRIRAVGRVWTGSFNGAVSRITLDPSAGPRVAREIDAFRPHVVHVQEPFVPALGPWALRHAGPALRVGTFHTYSEHSRGYLWAWPWCRLVGGLLDARVAVSVAARDYARRYHPAPFAVVPNGVRSPRPGSTRPAGPPGRPLRVLFAGRASEPRKGFAVLAAAMAIARRAAPGALDLTVAGPDRPPADSGAGRWIERPGDETLSKAYAAADLVVVPSLGGESFGLVALEALAHGAPVLASRIRGYAEWLEARGGAELFPAGDAETLARRMLALADDPERHARMAAAAPATAAAYSIDAVCGRLLALYEAAGVDSAAV